MKKINRPRAPIDAYRLGRNVPLSFGCPAEWQPPMPPSIPIISEDKAREIISWGARRCAPKRRRHSILGGRPAMGWTRLGEEMGIHPGTLHQMAAGKRRPDVTRIQAWYMRQAAKMGADGQPG